MLERKRVLKQIKSETTDGDRVLIYEHAKTGDVFIVPDPQLRLDEIEQVQDEVSQPVAGERCLTNYTFDDDTRPALVYRRKFSALSRAHGRRVGQDFSPALQILWRGRARDGVCFGRRRFSPQRTHARISRVRRDGAADRRATVWRERRAHGRGGASGRRLGRPRFHRSEFRLSGQQSGGEEWRLGAA